MRGKAVAGKKAGSRRMWHWMESCVSHVSAYVYREGEIM